MTVAVDAYVLDALKCYKLYLILVICIHIFLMKYITKILKCPIFVIGTKKEVVKLCASVPEFNGSIIFDSSIDP